MVNDTHLGRVIDNKYRIDEVIGAGGMATIYRATRLQIGDVVAIKVLHPELLREPKFAERFQREAQAAARLKHPNVVTIHDFGVCDDGLIYLVMELVEGPNLRTIIKEGGPMTSAAAAAIVRQVCAALTEAHRQGIIHRDIKPANIAVAESPDGPRVKVLDFGIASLKAETMVAFTQTGAVLGTPAYMSPEQCLGEDLDGRSDIYSLGVVLFEMLCGVVPFNSPTSTAVVMQHVQQAPPPLRVLNVSVSPAVEAVVLRALAKRREDRPQTAKEFADELTAAVSGAAPLRAGDDIGATQQFSAGQLAQTMVQSAVRPPERGAAAAVPPRRGWMFGALAGLAAAAALVAVWFGVQRVAFKPASVKQAAQPARPARTAAPRAIAYAPPPAQPEALATRPPSADMSYGKSIDLVNEYYRLWNAGEYNVMYGMLSSRMQRKNPYDQYVKYHSLVTGIGVNATAGYAPDVVNVHIVSHDREKDGSVTENVNEGRWLLAMENGQLKLDAQDAHEVHPPTVIAAPANPYAAPNAYVAPATPYVAPADPYAASTTSVNLVREYYRLWNTGDYPAMYRMLTSDMQRKHPYGDYVKYHALVVRIDAVVAPTESPAVVNVRIVSQDREKDGSITQSVNQGQWYLAMENGELKLNSQKLYEVK